MKDFEQQFKNCVICFLEGEQDIKMKDSGTPKISIYFMLGYLSTVLSKETVDSIEEQMQGILKARKEVK